MRNGAYIAGEIADWPSKERMAFLLRAAGLTVSVGPYAVRVHDCDHFSFEQYGGDLGPPRIAADASSLEDLMRDAKRVSEALARAGLRHRFEVYDGRGELAGYVHNDWPCDDPL